MSDFIITRQPKRGNVVGTENTSSAQINPATEETAQAILAASGGASYSTRYDEGATYTYIGSAVAGSSEASAVWQIKRMTNSNYTIVFADGDTLFNNIWANRASLSYS